MSTAQISGHYVEFTIHAGNLGLNGFWFCPTSKCPKIIKYCKSSKDRVKFQPPHLNRDFLRLFIWRRKTSCFQKSKGVLWVLLEHNIVDKNFGGGRGYTFLPRPNRAWGPPCLLYNGYRVSFPGVKGPERGFERTPNLVSRLNKEQSYNSNPLWAFMARSTVNFTLYIFDKAQ